MFLVSCNLQKPDMLPEVPISKFQNPEDLLDARQLLCWFVDLIQKFVSILLG